MTKPSSASISPFAPILCLLAVVFLLGGCAGPDGRPYPPDPLGHALFGAIYRAQDPPPQTVYQTREVIYQ